MHCALQEISTESPKISKPGKDSLSRKQQEKILRASLKVTKVGYSHFGMCLILFILFLDW